jgi:hypothetical protein
MCMRYWFGLKNYMCMRYWFGLKNYMCMRYWFGLKKLHVYEVLVWPEKTTCV